MGATYSIFLYTGALATIESAILTTLVENSILFYFYLWFNRYTQPRYVSIYEKIQKPTAVLQYISLLYINCKAYRNGKSSDVKFQHKVSILDFCTCLMLYNCRLNIKYVNWWIDGLHLLHYTLSLDIYNNSI